MLTATVDVFAICKNVLFKYGRFEFRQVIREPFSYLEARKGFSHHADAFWMAMSLFTGQYLVGRRVAFSVHRCTTEGSSSSFTVQFRGLQVPVC